MTPVESDQALRQLQTLYDLTRRAPLTADEHDTAKASALAIAARLRPDPKAAAADSPVVKDAAERFIPKDAVKPARTRRGKVS